MRLFIVSLVYIFVGCAATPMPENVQTRPYRGSNQIIDTIDHSFFAAESPSFSQVKICEVETVRNDEVGLEDSSRSFVGAYTGNYYNVESREKVGGGNTIRLIDEQSSTIIASGVSPFTHALLTNYLRYDVKLSPTENGSVIMIFSRLVHAQIDTGYLSNSGFGPVGTWAGTGAPVVLETIEQVATSLKNCITR